MFELFRVSCYCTISCSAVFHIFFVLLEGWLRRERESLHKKRQAVLNNTECLETEKRLFPRKIIESAYIKANRNRCMNLNEGLGVTTIYGKGKEGWLRRERESLHKKDKLCSSVVT